MPITLTDSEFRTLIKKIDAIYAFTLNKDKSSKWMGEKEVISMTNLSPRSLQARRMKGVFNWSSATGRKIMYLRKDVENYLDNNSTIKK